MEEEIPFVDDDQLITLQTFDNSFQANLAKARLEDAGLQAYLFDENMMNLNILYNITIGGIKLKVPLHEAKLAAEVLSKENLEPITNDDGHPVICPKCNSDDVVSGIKGAKSFPAVIASIFSLLTATYPLYADHVYFCRNCKHDFRE